MKHNIRINGVIKEIECRLGSDVYDKHGREIFEGDIVRTCYDLYIAHCVIFTNGVFILDKELLKDYCRDDLEIVGRVDD